VVTSNGRIINGIDVIGKTRNYVDLACCNVISKYLELGGPVDVVVMIHAVRPRNRNKFAAGTIELYLLKFVQTAPGPTQVSSQ
jgi:hypothetical protein